MKMTSPNEEIMYAEAKKHRTDTFLSQLSQDYAAFNVTHYDWGRPPYASATSTF